MNKGLMVGVLLLSGLLGLAVSFYLHHDDIAPTRIQTIQTYHYPTLFVKQLEGDPEAGKKIVKEYCSSCHGRQPIIDVNAPMIGNNKLWSALCKNPRALLRVTLE